MGQSGYAETFTNIMLGWIRNLASSVASMFQTSGGGASGGLAVLNWFANNWIGLLVTLIVLGILTDWVVWLIRWRPHWLWFHKRRIILDDDIDDELTERELARYYDRDRAEPPRFRSTVLNRDDADDEDGDYGYDEAYGDEEYDDDEYSYDDEYEDDDAQGEDEYEDGDWDAAYGESVESPDDAWMTDDEWDDVPKPPRGKKRPSLFSRRAKKEDEDPFAVDEDEYRDLDDGFYEVVSEAPLYASDSAVPPASKLDPLPDRTDDGDYDERIGYRSSFEPKAGTALSRKSRRKR